MSKTVLYQSVGRELSLFDVDVANASLTKRSSVTLPANVQYAWPHPSRRFLYVVSSDGGPGSSGIRGSVHRASALRIDPGTGELSPHGDAIALSSRPIHASVDERGDYLLVAYNTPSNVTVHGIKADGSLGEEVTPSDKLDTGVFAHQIVVTPGNRGAILVTRGNDAAPGRAEEPGALKLYGFKAGVLSNRASVQPGNGLGFGPRHLDFHPALPLVFVSVERQSELHVYRLEGDGTLSPNPLFVKTSLAQPDHVRGLQQAGAIHIHPNGDFVYVSNRNSTTIERDGKRVFAGGENNIAVYAINRTTGEPDVIQHIDARTNHVRTFSLDAKGELLIAASTLPIALPDASILSAALTIYRIGRDGKLEFARKYDVDTGSAAQWWTGILTLANAGG
jgi:6-phosphogluconolactonase (cycloisomerase 2 family)